MSLNVTVSLDRTSYAVGANPPPRVLLTVYNPTADTVAVTGVQFFFQRLDQLHPTPSAASMVAPVGLGATVSVATLSSIIIGPTYLALGSAAAYTASTNPQPSQPISYPLLVGAYVKGSDGSVNIGLPVGITVGPRNTPAGAQAFAAGNLCWGFGQNLLFSSVLGVL